MAKNADRRWKKTSKHPEVEKAALEACRHPHIVSLLEVDGPNLWLEWLEGPTLAQKTVSQPLSILEAEKCAAELLDTVRFIHAAGWLHNDISPQNIIWTSSGVVLVDFDAATPADHADGLPMLGTIHYMAPERLAGDPPSIASDLYSLGITLYEALTSQLPYNATTKAQIITAHHRHLFTPIEKVRRDLPQSLISIVGRLTSRQPCDRMSDYATP
ncbi:MAG: serine/threonine protein kinase [Verrucomicrobiaceae bacterium]|nr:serine/threonine protein kinase [Verrucomicrobiaceae bacterium]